jgi:hypothetical protein
MSYTGNGYMLGGFFDHISGQDAAEALAEATIDHIDNAVFRDMYMDTINEALDNGVDYLDKYDEGNYLKENLEDAMLGLGTDVADMDLGVTPGSYVPEAYASEWDGTTTYDDEYDSCYEAGIEKCIDALPDGDPAEAGTYFSLVNRVNAEGDPEARAAIKEQLDMVSAFIPDTEIVAEDATAPITNQLNFSNCRDKCPEHYNKRTQKTVNSSGNAITQPEVFIDQETDALRENYGVDEVANLEDFFPLSSVHETADGDKYANMLPGDRLKAKMAAFQAERDAKGPDLSTSKGRIQANVQTSQQLYKDFQNKAAADPNNTNKYRSEWQKSALQNTAIHSGIDSAKAIAGQDPVVGKGGTNWTDSLRGEDARV